MHRILYITNEVSYPWLDVGFSILLSVQCSLCVGYIFRWSVTWNLLNLLLQRSSNSGTFSVELEVISLCCDWLRFLSLKGNIQYSPWDVFLEVRVTFSMLWWIYCHDLESSVNYLCLKHVITSVAHIIVYKEHILNVIYLSDLNILLVHKSNHCCLIMLYRKTESPFWTLSK